MKWESRKWREDSGSIDFIQVVVGLMIVAISCVGTFQALGFGYDQMNYQMRYRKAMSIARSYVEYWQGRIHTDFPNDVRTMQGNLNRPVPTTVLDLGDPNLDADDVYCYVRYGAITPVYNIELGNDADGHPIVSYWNIKVEVTWWEPGQPLNTLPKRVTFDGAMVPAAL